jgi:hypothetical protein
MDLRGYRAFATEMTKIALHSAEALARKAERRGDEYLMGGQLPSNNPAETGIVVKLAARKIAPPVIMDKLQNPTTKDEGTYQQVRDTALTGLGGALTGSGVIKLHEAIRGGGYKATSKQHVVGAGIGAATALADRAYRHRGELFPKTAMMGSGTFTPGRALHQAQETRQFHDHDIHTTAKARPAGLVGNKFRLPTQELRK